MLIVSALLFACNSMIAQPEPTSYEHNAKQTRSAISLENDQSVSNCIEYNLARATHRIKETVFDSLIASEYLSCSLLNTTALEPTNIAVIQQQLLQLRVRQLPWSIAQLFGRNTRLNEAGFMLQNDVLVWYQEQHTVQVQLKAKHADIQQRYLIWVLDEINDASYRAYYPAWVSIFPERIDVTPVYASGF